MILHCIVLVVVVAVKVQEQQLIIYLFIYSTERWLLFTWSSPEIH